MQQHFHLDQLAPRSDRLLDLSNCTWSADNRLIGLSPSQPRALHDALQRAPQEQSTPYGDLDHFESLAELISVCVQRNKSVAIVRPDNTMTIVRDDGSDPDFPEKALGEEAVRPNALEDGCAFDNPAEFAAWALESTWCGDGLGDGGTNARNYAAEYLIRNCAWTPLSGAVLFAHADHGIDPNPVASNEASGYRSD